MAVLEHEGDCVGAWTYEREQASIACAGCGQRYPATLERRFAAEFDAVLSGHMRAMAAQGAALLARRGGGGARWTL